MIEKELRLALVCYGGISLAVYMHGITREVWHLARASRAFHDLKRGDARATNGESRVDGVEECYLDLLQVVEEVAGVRLRVLADIVAGASAGGINGIFLAQAVATGQSLDPLTQLWLDHADVDALLDSSRGVPSRVSALWAGPVARAFAGRNDDELPPPVRDELRAKLSRVVRARWFEPPFGGPGFDRLLLRAFDAMAAGPIGPRLLPDDQPLDLFVTVTDFGGHPERLPIHSPPEIVETEHRLTLAFREASGAATLGEIPDLVFAARATSSFPGAFPPFTVAELDKVLSEDGRDWAGRDAFFARTLPHGVAESTVLIDGSVLANAPFRPAIDALRNRPARREVDRRFVYIDPKPGRKSIGLPRADAGSVPGFFTTLFGAMSDIPRTQPIRDNIEAIAAHSARIARTCVIIEALRPQVENAVEAMFGRTLFLDRPTTARLATWRARAAERAARDASHSFVAYRELVRIGVVDLLTRASTGIAPDAIAAALHDYEDLSMLDLRYRIRRLRFVIRRLAVLAEAEDTADYEAVRNVVFSALARYIERDDASYLGTIQTADAAELVKLATARLDLRTLDAQTDAALADVIGACLRTRRRAPLLAYLGFPFYDVATLALLQGEGFDEFDPVKVDRIAPEDARSLADGTAPLKGTQLNSFGAFFSRAYRENDYLWGRLHGAERLVEIIVSTLAAGALTDSAVASAKAGLFTAILDAEALRLTTATDLIAELRTRVTAMTGQAASPGID